MIKKYRINEIKHKLYILYSNLFCLLENNLLPLQYTCANISSSLQSSDNRFPV